MTAAGASPTGWRSTIPRPWRRSSRRHHPDRRGVAAHHAAVGRQDLSLAVPGPAVPAARDADRQGSGLLSGAHAQELGRPARPVAVLAPEALAHYRALLQDPARVHAICEDYRAGAEHRPHPRRGRPCRRPQDRLSDARAVPAATCAGDPLDIWRAWCTNVSGAIVTSGHFLAEENPQETLAALIPFLPAHRRGCMSAGQGPARASKVRAPGRRECS